MAQEVENAANQLEGLEWLGELPHSEVVDLMGRASVVLVPSLWEEPFGRTVIEAFARGTPVVASDQGALPELVRHGVNGLIVPSVDAEALSGAVKRLVSGDCDLAAMRRAARQEYLNRFGPEVAHAKLIAIYQEALAVRGDGLDSASKRGEPAASRVPA